MKYNAVLFDFDGVIAETMPYHVQAWRTVFSKYKIEIRAEDIYFQEGQIADEIARNIAKKNGITLPDEEFDLFIKN